MQTEELSQYFALDGPLATAFNRYVPRKQQLELSQAVAETVTQRGILVAEAGTGTGKTWAYLLPLLVNEHKALISTGTRTLQDQLFHRDLPELCRALGLQVRTALLKGRSNYLCHYHFEQLGKDESAFKDKSEVQQYELIRHFLQQTDTGDKSELAKVAENAPIWHKVTSTRENCLGQDCPFINECFVYQARRRAQDADIVVINHALFMADWVLREEGVYDLLPETEAIVFDEAHHLPATATRFLGISVSSYQLRDFTQALVVGGQSHAAGIQNWLDWANKIKHVLEQLRLDCLSVKKQNGHKSTFENLPNADAVDESIASLLALLAELIEILAGIEAHHPDLKALHLRCIGLYSRLFLWTQPNRQGQIKTSEFMDDKDEAHLAQPSVRWVENNQQMLRFHRAPLTVNHIFGQAHNAQQAWIFTSATLSVRGDFSHFLNQLGLQQAQTKEWPSPFNYREQAVLFVPEKMPPPHSQAFNQAFVTQLWPLIKETEGGVLVLCTTLRAVEHIAQALKQKNKQAQAKRFILSQGKQSKNQLLKQFLERPESVLIGSASFWEGVDFPGEALTLVAIDKLPFAPPDDPVISARIERCRQEGGNPFMTFQLPEAAITLKQGAGRLIRSEHDYGILMIADTRIVEKSYGRILWQGLPPFRRTRNLKQAIHFLKISSQKAQNNILNNSQDQPAKA